MHVALIAIQERLLKLIGQLEKQIPNDEPFGNAHGNWSFPGLTKSEMIEQAESILSLIEERGTDSIPTGVARITDYTRRLEFLTSHTVQNVWGNGGQAVSAYVLTLDGLRRALEPALNRDIPADLNASLRRSLARARGIETQLNSLEPRTGSLTQMVSRIEGAYASADQLPTDLESLSEARKQVEALLRSANADQVHLLSVRGNGTQLTVG